MISTPALVMPNFNEPFVIESDTLGEEISVVLTLQGKSIAFRAKLEGFQN